MTPFQSEAESVDPPPEFQRIYTNACSSTVADRLVYTWISTAQWKSTSKHTVVEKYVETYCNFLVAVVVAAIILQVAYYETYMRFHTHVLVRTFQMSVVLVGTVVLQG